MILLAITGKDLVALRQRALKRSFHHTTNTGGKLHGFPGRHDLCDKQNHEN